MKVSISLARRKSTPGRKRVYAIAFIIALASIAASPAPAAQGASVRVESFMLRPDGLVRIENTLGSTNVTTWESNNVRIVAEKKSPRGSALHPSEMVMMSAQNTVLVQCKQIGTRGRIDLMIYVPRGIQLQLLGGPLPVEVSGSLSSAVVETTGGEISYRVPKSDDARVVMQSVRGSVRSMAPIAVSHRAGNKGLQGTLGQGTSPIFLSSHTGNITLYESQDLPAVAGLQADPPATTPETSEQPQSRRGAAPPFSRPAGSGIEDQSDRDTNSRDTNSIAVPPSQRAAGQPNQQPTQRSSGGSVVFAGENSDVEDSQADRVGPLSGERREKRQEGGNMGLSVRIIPSGETLNSGRRQTPSPYDDDQRYDDQRDGKPGGNTRTSSTQTSRSGGIGGSRTSSNRDTSDTYDQRPNGGYPQQDSRRSAGRRDEAVDDSIFPRPGAPPVLRRNTENDAAGDISVTNPAKGEKTDDDAIVLNSALVSLNVSVTNRSGKSLSDLSEGEFEVYENGERQNIEFFSPSSAPFNLVLVLDLSGSIQDKLNVVKSAALKFLDVIGPQDKVAILTFTDKVRVVSSLSSNRDTLRKRVKSIGDAGGGTAFYEAMWFAIADTLRGTQGQRNAVVVMTDGVDSSLDRYDPLPTRVTFEQLARRLEESDVLVFPIYLDTEFDEVFRGNRSSSESYAIARVQLERLAELTGAQPFRAERVEDLSGVYKQVAAALRTVYSVGYYPTNAERDGSYHRVRVVVNRPDAAVRTRRGYYAK